jgi:hypothetical protein
MKVRKLLWSGLATSAVLFTAGAAISGDPATTTTNLLVAYNDITKELSGIPTGEPGAVIYLHDATTVHIAGDLTRFTPPDPCLPIAETWNAVVAYDDRIGRTSTYVFDALLFVMSDLHCSASVTATDGTPQPIVVIAPTAPR